MSDSGPSGSEASNQGEYFYVEKILDVKQEGRNEDARRYRVRWAGYGPQSDTWEPSSNFHPTLLQQFESHYERMRKERVAFLQESGQNVSLEDIVDVNILSKEIEEITKKKTQCGSQRRTFYEVKWQGSKVRTWEMDKDLIHAQDKVDAFLHRIRVSRLNRKTPTCSQDYLSNHEKRVKERAFYEAVEKGEVVSLEMDLYSRVKNGRSSSKEQPSPSKPSSSKTRKRIMQIDSSDETSDEESKVAGEHLGSCSNPKDNREKSYRIAQITQEEDFYQVFHCLTPREVNRSLNDWNDKL
ncbi:M-phase phosphoprotein 8-like isoform X4 [Macrobrachium rosenbergii]